MDCVYYYELALTNYSTKAKQTIMLPTVQTSVELQGATEKVFNRLLPNDKLFMEEESTVVKLYLVGLKCLMVLCVIVLLIVGILFVFLDRATHDKIILLRNIWQRENQTSLTG